MDLASAADNLEMREAGLWCSSNQSDVPYPETGHDWTRQFEERSFWLSHRNACALAAIRLFPPTGAVLDIGGGNGSVSLAIRNAGMEAVLLEPGPTGVSIARARGLSPVICSTFEDAGFRDGAIPAAGLFDVLEHMPADVDFLSTVRRALVRGGRLYATVPAYKSLWSIEDDFGGHHRRYRVSTLRATLERAGFDVEFATYIFSVLPLPIWFARTLPSRLGLRKQVSLETETRAHTRDAGPLGGMLKAALRLELALLERGNTIPAGASCLVVAKNGNARVTSSV